MRVALHAAAGLLTARPRDTRMCVQRVPSGRLWESRDCAEIEAKLHQLLTGAHAVTGIAAEAPPEVQPPNDAYHCSGAGASEGRRAW
jgi:hypothetical protein